MASMNLSMISQSGFPDPYLYQSYQLPPNSYQFYQPWSHLTAASNMPSSEDRSKTQSSPASSSSSSNSSPASSPRTTPISQSPTLVPSSIASPVSIPPVVSYLLSAPIVPQQPQAAHLDANPVNSSPDKDVRNMNDSGNSSLSSLSSPSSDAESGESSPVISKSSVSPDGCQVKKNNRTNYSPQQVRSLEKIFLETPYPEIELFEKLSRDLIIPAKNVKIWFQNKRARWRKRVQNNKPTFPPGYPVPVPSSVSPYNMTSPSSLMSAVPTQVPNRPGYNLPAPHGQIHPMHYPAYLHPFMFPQYR